MCTVPTIGGLHSIGFAQREVGLIRRSDLMGGKMHCVTSLKFCVRPFSLARISALVLLGVATFGTRGFGAAISAAEFSRLTQTDQLAALKESLFAFRRRTANISATVTHSASNYDYNPYTKQIGNKPLLVSGRDDYRIRRIGTSYRVLNTRNTPDLEPGVVDPVVIEGYDSQTGTGRQLDVIKKERGEPLNVGVIRSKRGSASKNCFFFEYLGDDGHPYDQGNWGGWFLKNIDSATVTRVDSVAGTVEVAFPLSNSDPDVPKGNGACRILFDLNHDALPKTFAFDIEREMQKGLAKNSIRQECSEFKRFDGVWIPTRWDVRAWASVLPNTLSVHQGAVSDIKLNQLSPDDLEVTFPSNTEVEDQLRGTRYRLDSHGNRVPSTIYSLPNLPADSRADERGRGWSARRLLFVIGMPIVLAIAAVAMRMRSNRA